MSTQPAELSLREALPAALQRGDSAAVSAIRSALAALENAAAVKLPGVAPSPAGSAAATPYAGSIAGLGVTEMSRAELTEAEELAILSDERDDRLRAALVYRDHGKPDAAERMLAEAEVLDSFLC